MDDFDACFKASQADTGVSLKRKAPEAGELRAYLRVYETLPAQLLNAYGLASFTSMDPEEVWKGFNKPLKTGAMYMTELCSAIPERRGVGINRFLQTLVEYLKYQKTEQKKAQNQAIMKEEIFDQLYREIDLVFTYATYCLAGKKQYIKKGASSLRSGVSLDQTEEKRTDTDLKKNAELLYKLINLEKSKLRMIMGWQASGGLPYVAGTHLYGMRCFVSYGNTCHDKGEKTVSLEDFQEAVCMRHKMEQQGHEYKEEKADFM